MRRPYLMIEGATDAGSVAVVENGGVIANREFGARDAVTGARTELLGAEVQRAIAEANLRPAQLAGVVCDDGPGSFTSLRCAAAIAKGVCTPLDLPLYVISSLELLALSAPQLSPGPYVAALDAGRSEWFASGFHVLGNGGVSMTATKVVSDSALRASAAASFTPLVGRGLDIDAVPRASAVLAVLDRLVEAEPVALDSWEPDYGRLAEAQLRWEVQHGRPLVG